MVGETMTASKNPFHSPGKKQTKGQRMKNKYYSNNMRALEKRYPELVRELQAIDSSHGASDFKSRQIKTDPNQSAARLDEELLYWKRKPLRNPGLMIFLGLDDGYRLLAYLKAPNPNTQIYLLIEKDLNAFHQLLYLNNLVPTIQNQKAHLVVGVPEKKLHARLFEIAANNLIFTFIKAAAVEGGSKSYGLDPSYYKTALTAFKDSASQLLLDVGNDPCDSFIGTRHMLLNLDFIARNPAAQDLFGHFKKVPAVIVATGPSLDKNYRSLAKIQDRAIIISVDASLGFLLKNGIKPHFATSLERGPNVVRCYKGIDPDLCRDTVQLAAPVVMPETYSAYPGPKAVLYRKIHHFPWLKNPKGTLDTGPSAANMGFKLAEALGCDPIILVGQDLAYADDGSTHAAAAPWGKSWKETTPEATKTLYVKGNLCDQILTTWAWNLFRQHFIQMIGAYGGTVINATEGGAYIDGTLFIPLETAIEEYINGEERPLAQEIRDLLNSPSRKDADEYLGWIRSVRAPETVARLNAQIIEGRAIANSARKALCNNLEVPEMARLGKESLNFFSRLLNDDLLAHAAGQVVQPSFVHLLVDHHDIPNRVSHTHDIVKKRLEVHTKHLETTCILIEKLAALFSDPVNTLP